MTHMDKLEVDYVEMDNSWEGSQEALMSKRDSPLVKNQSGTTLSDITQRKRKNRTAKGSSTKRVDASWYVFDNLSCEQAEDLLRRHGDNGTYLIAHFHDPESYGLSIRLTEGKEAIYKHYAIGISGDEFQVEGFSHGFSTLEALTDAVQDELSQVKLVPIFHTYNCETCDYSISMSAEEPPAYSSAHKYPTAARRPLPLIVPIRPTLRRMMHGTSNIDAYSSEDEHTEESEEVVHHGCCWKLFHTDPNGQWYKPQKAGPVTGFFLIIGWIIFLLLFGWIIALALILVFILIVFAYLLNFICTGRCQIEDDEEEEVTTTIGGRNV